MVQNHFKSKAMGSYVNEIEGLKVICEKSREKPINLLRRNNSIKGDKIIRLKKKKTPSRLR